MNVQILVTAAPLAVIALLGIIWHSRIRAARRVRAVADAHAEREITRLRAAMDAYAQREIAREQRWHSPRRRPVLRQPTKILPTSSSLREVE